MEKEQMSLAVVGHVDHGKSTVIGRLMADTGALPQGKLESIQEKCQRESKVFEYAFLLDALKDEQAQGITIDSARCFFKTEKRDYLIIDAPGHIEFLKNMVSGAARAEGALLVIDAQEGIQENSRRHGYLLSLLGVTQIVVLINKMDLVNYNEEVFQRIKKEYETFLQGINIQPKEFLPVSALNGDNISQPSPRLAWWPGRTVLEALDHFVKSPHLDNKPFRMYVQDVYKFTKENDSRRIIAGRIDSGKLEEGDEVIFLPSGKRTKIKSLETFSPSDRGKTQAGYPLGVTLTEQLYVSRGQLMCKEKESLPFVSSLIKSNLFWMGKKPMEKNKEYLFKIGTAKVKARIKKLLNVLNSSDLTKTKKSRISKNEVAECELELSSPIAYDLIKDIPPNGRFVIVDGYDIAGGGIITEFLGDKQSHLRQQVLLREKNWDRSFISYKERAERYGQLPKLILITGLTGLDKKVLARHLEKRLFDTGRKVYFLGIRNILRGLDADIKKEKKKEHIRRLGEVANILIDSGLIVLATASDLDTEKLKLLQTIINKDQLLIINLGPAFMDENFIDLQLSPEEDLNTNLSKILDLLNFKNLIFHL